MAEQEDAEFRAGRGRLLKDAFSRSRLTMARLAEKARLDEKTIRKAFDGQIVRNGTIVSLCEVLGVPYDAAPPAASRELADLDFGEYSRLTYRNYEGYYFYYRKSFHDDGDIVRSVVSIHWDERLRRFLFKEHDFETPATKFHSGSVYISAYTNLVHLLTVNQGSVRLMTVVKMRERDGVMRGTIHTQRDAVNYFQPTVAAVLLKKIDDPPPEITLFNRVGRVEPLDADHEFARRQIELTQAQAMKVIL